mmetsp:Transcript_68345/g.211461  ORF Transcript_68345/g.211461 Transcript_68345/m.211461 type:complete len:244 (-) Transcript_68345:35-766(-)
MGERLRKRRWPLPALPRRRLRRPMVQRQGAWPGQLHPRQRLPLQRRVAGGPAARVRLGELAGRLHVLRPVPRRPQGRAWALLLGGRLPLRRRVQAERDPWQRYLLLERRQGIRGPVGHEPHAGRRHLPVAGWEVLRRWLRERPEVRPRCVHMARRTLLRRPVAGREAARLRHLYLLKGRGHHRGLGAWEARHGQHDGVLRGGAAPGQADPFPGLPVSEPPSLSRPRLESGELAHRRQRGEAQD